MKALLYTVAVLFFSSQLYGQDPDIGLAQDPQAEPYLEFLANEFNTDEAFQVEFKYEIYSKIEDAKVSDYGSVIIKKEKYKLKTEDTQVFFNGKTMWTYSPENQEVYQSEPDEKMQKEMLGDPFRSFSNYKENFKYKYKGETSIKGRKHVLIDLYPADIEVNYSIIHLTLNPESNSLYSFTIQQKNGIEITILIKDVIEGLQIIDEAFNWNTDDYPDILLIEM